MTIFALLIVFLLCFAPIVGLIFEYWCYFVFHVLKLSSSYWSFTNNLPDGTFRVLLIIDAKNVESRQFMEGITGRNPFLL